MDLAPDWRAHLSFADRMSVILKISDAFQAASSASTVSEARAEARKAEDDILQQATSRESYERDCLNVIRDYKESTADEAANESRPDQSTSAQSQESQPHGLQIGPFKNLIYHKSGLFSTVYKFRDGQGHHSYYALKVTNPSVEQPPHNSTREARLLSMAIHQNIVRMLDAVRLPDGRLCLQFIYENLTLEEVLSSKGRVNARKLIRDLFIGLQSLHSANILHRDIKPSNILLTGRASESTEYNEYQLVIADFGVAWQVDDPDSEPADAKITDIGTTCYRAPELLFGCRDYENGVDLWAAGCVTAEILRHDVMMRWNGNPCGDWTLFNAGELGSELALVKSIFETLGTPNEASWPDCTTLPDWGKISFIDFPAKDWKKILPGVKDSGIEIMSKLIQYQSTERMTARQVLSHRFIRGDNPPPIQLLRLPPDLDLI